MAKIHDRIVSNWEIFKDDWSTSDQIREDGVSVFHLHRNGEIIATGTLHELDERGIEIQNLQQLVAEKLYDHTEERYSLPPIDRRIIEIVSTYIREK